MEIFMHNIVIGCDPGANGGLTFLQVDDKKNITKSTVIQIPVIKQNKGTKKKPKIATTIDHKALSEIFSQYSGMNVQFVSQRVTGRQGQAPNRAFNFGFTCGVLVGCAAMAGFDVRLISPQSWKKTFSKIKTPQVLAQQMRHDQQKQKGTSLKQLKKIKAKVKSLQKSAARALAAQLFPSLSDNYKKVADDGKAQSSLIAAYTVNHII